VLGFREFLFLDKTFPTLEKEQRMKRNIKMQVPVGINEDTDASVEPRQERISSLYDTITTMQIYKYMTQ